MITGYRIRNGVWTLLGKGNPQAPQVNNVVCLLVICHISFGEHLHGLCTSAHLIPSKEVIHAMSSFPFYTTDK